jgi:hypothetical protein
MLKDGLTVGTSGNVSAEVDAAAGPVTTYDQ